jgi:hypothetical protein
MLLGVCFFWYAAAEDDVYVEDFDSEEQSGEGEREKDAGEGGNLGVNPRILLLEWRKSPGTFFVANFLIFFFMFCYQPRYMYCNGVGSYNLNYFSLFFTFFFQCYRSSTICR